MNSLTIKKIAVEFIIIVVSAVSALAQQNTLDNIFTVSNGKGEKTLYFHWINEEENV